MQSIKTLQVLLSATIFVVGMTSQHECRQNGFSQCRPQKISLINGTPDDYHHRVILSELCNAGIGHRKNKAKVLPFKYKNQDYDEDQLAVLNIHSNASSEEVNWNAGISPKNVACMPDWNVDAIDKLRVGEQGNARGYYYWYHHGLPMWPFIYQDFAHHHRKLTRTFLRSKLDWPNYAIAIPVYQILKECQSHRTPITSVRKLFKNSTFAKSRKYQKYVDKFMEDIKGINCNEFSRPEDYNNWLKFLIDRSLSGMLHAAKVRAKKCPAELYIFFNKEPEDRFVNDMMKGMNSALGKIKCRSTSIVIGFYKIC